MKQLGLDVNTSTPDDSGRVKKTRKLTEEKNIRSLMKFKEHEWAQMREVLKPIT